MPGSPTIPAANSQLPIPSGTLPSGMPSGIPGGLPGNIPQGADNPLANLKDIHHPLPIDFFPPAAGWWIVAICLLTILVTLLILIYQRWRKQAPIRAALRQLKALESQYQNQPNHLNLVNEVAILLKRLSLTRHAREEVAGLTGKQWLEYLDKTGNTNRFTQGEGSILAEARYNPANSNALVNVSELIQLSRQWVKRQ